MSKLIVFVHGLGADDDDWWGSTRDLLEKKYQDENTQLYFHAYKTEKLSGIVNNTKLMFGMGNNLADLDGLGGQMVAKLEHYIRDNNITDVKLFGHSMGGIVIASAVWKLKYGTENQKNIFNKISSIALCGTPLGGSNVAKIAKKIFSFAASKHTKALSIDSRDLHNIVNNFKSCVALFNQSGLPQLRFFVIDGDEVVRNNDEKFGPYNSKDILGNKYTQHMTGTHVGAVQNLTSDSTEYGNIVNWINDESIDDIFTDIPDRHIDNFKLFIENIYTSKYSLQELKKIYLIYLEQDEVEADGFRKRPYVDIELSSRKTYLQNQNTIVDFRRYVKVIDKDRSCDFEFSNGFIKESKYANQEFLDELALNLENNVYKNRFEEYTLKLGIKINGAEKIHIVEDFDVISDYETENTKGIRIICRLGEYAVGTEIEFHVSLSLPSALWEFPHEKDIFSFPVTTLKRQYVIQEEIYGSNRPCLTPDLIGDKKDIEVNNDRSLYYNRFVFVAKTISDESPIVIRYNKNRKEILNKNK